MWCHMAEGIVGRELKHGELSRVFAKAVELFRGGHGGRETLVLHPAKALGGERPIAVARTELGTREVEALIDRLEQGVLT